MDKPGEITLLSQKLKKGEINQEEFNLLSREVLEKPSLPKPMKIGSVNLGSKQILGISGSAILFFGVFTPIIQIPFYGYQNFFQNGKGGGVLIILFSFLALYGTLTGVNALLKTASLGAFCILGFTFINFHLKMADAKSDLDAQLTGSPFAGFAEVALQSVQLSWGWAVLILGAGLLLAAAMIKDTANADE